MRPAGAWPQSPSGAFARWLNTNTRPQKQEGYVVVTVALPLGDITANQLRSLADIARQFTRETVRTTVEQNFVLRWISKSDLQEVYDGPRSRGAGRGRRGNHHRYRHLPGHRHVQAGDFLFARPGCGVAQEARGKKL